MTPSPLNTPVSRVAEDARYDPSILAEVLKDSAERNRPLVKVLMAAMSKEKAK